MSKDDGELLRRLAGERPATGGPERPGEAAEGDRLAALWAALEPPAAEPAPPGFAGRVMARVREEAPRRDTLTRRFGVLPARLAAASALSAGLVAGAGLGTLIATPAGEGEGRAPAIAADAADGAGRAGRAATGGGRADVSGRGNGEASGGLATGEAGRASSEEPPAGAARTAGDGGDASREGALADDVLADEELLDAAVAAAADTAADAPEEELDAGFGAAPDLAGDYLAALAALEEAS